MVFQTENRRLTGCRPWTGQRGCRGPPLQTGRASWERSLEPRADLAQRLALSNCQGIAVAKTSISASPIGAAGWSSAKPHHGLDRLSLSFSSTLTFCTADFAAHRPSVSWLETTLPWPCRGPAATAGSFPHGGLPARGVAGNSTCPVMQRRPFYRLPPHGARPLTASPGCSSASVASHGGMPWARRASADCEATPILKWPLSPMRGG